VRAAAVASHPAKASWRVGGKEETCYFDVVLKKFDICSYTFELSVYFYCFVI